jgi:DNA-binding SARP family transcriptional activator
MTGSSQHAPAVIEFRVLGPFEVRIAGQRLELRAQKPRALLAALVLRANTVVSADRLIDELWGDQPPATAPHVLQVYVSQLRKALAPTGTAPLEHRSPGYVLRADADDVDLARFERRLEAGSSALRRGDAEAALAALTDALALWRGPALADLADEPLAHTAILRLDELRLLAVEERVDAELALGRHDHLVPELRSLVAEHAHRERLWGQLMVALYRSGRQPDALEAFRAGRRALLDELGIDPTPALQALQAAILRQDPSLDAPQAVPLQTAEEPRRTLVAIALEDADLAPLARAGAVLAGGPAPVSIVLARVVAVAPDASADPDLAGAARAAEAAARPLTAAGLEARSACFRTFRPAADIARLATTTDAQLLLFEATAQLGDDVRLPDTAVGAVAAAACDAAFAVGWGALAEAGDVVVPFFGSEHDWASLELAGRFCESSTAPLRLVGAVDAQEGIDSSFLLATASLALQRLTGVVATPALARREPEAMVEACAGARLIITGLSSRGLGASLGSWRLALARAAVAPLLLVRRGVRPGLGSPADAASRYTWTVLKEV